MQASINKRGRGDELRYESRTEAGCGCDRCGRDGCGCWTRGLGLRRYHEICGYELRGQAHIKNEWQLMILWVVLPVAIHQGLVALTEVNAEPAPRHIDTALAYNAIGEQRRHTPAAERQAIFAAQGQPIASDGVDVPD